MLSLYGTGQAFSSQLKSKYATPLLRLATHDQFLQSVKEPASPTRFPLDWSNPIVDISPPAEKIYRPHAIIVLGRVYLLLGSPSLA